MPVKKVNDDIYVSVNPLSLLQHYKNLQEYKQSKDHTVSEPKQIQMESLANVSSPYKGMSIAEARMDFIRKVFSTFMTKEERERIFPSDMSNADLIQNKLPQIAEFTKNIYLGDASQETYNLYTFHDTMELEGRFDLSEANKIEDPAERKKALDEKTEQMLGDLEACAAELGENLWRMAAGVRFRTPADSDKKGFGGRKMTGRYAPYIMRKFSGSDAPLPVIIETKIERFNNTCSSYNDLARKAAVAVKKKQLTLKAPFNELDPGEVEAEKMERNVSWMMEAVAQDAQTKKGTIVSEGRAGAVNTAEQNSGTVKKASASHTGVVYEQPVSYTKNDYNTGAVDRFVDQMLKMNDYMQNHCNPDSWFKSREYARLVVKMNQLSETMQFYKSVRSKGGAMPADYVQRMLDQCAETRETAAKYAYMKNASDSAKYKSGTGMNRYRNALNIAARIDTFLEANLYKRYEPMKSYHEGLKNGEPGRGSSLAKVVADDNARLADRRMNKVERDEKLLMDFTGQADPEKAVLAMTRLNYTKVRHSDGTAIREENQNTERMIDHLGLNKIDFYDRSSYEKCVRNAAKKLRYMLKEQSSVYTISRISYGKKNMMLDGNVDLSPASEKVIFNEYDCKVFKGSAPALSTDEYNKETHSKLPAKSYIPGKVKKGEEKAKLNEAGEIIVPKVQF